MAEDSALTDVLDALHHDLGKYLSMPLRMLPRDASDSALRAAIAAALLRTQRSQQATRSAREIYESARAELATHSADRTRLTALDAAVQQALAWERVLSEPFQAQIDRHDVERDFARVRELLEDWRDEASLG